MAFALSPFALTSDATLRCDRRAASILCTVLLTTVVDTIADGTHGRLVAVLCLVIGGAAPFAATFRAASVAAVGLHVVLLAQAFPYAANHLYLQTVILTLVALSDPRDAKRTAWAAMRWATVMLFFWSGVQKLLYGGYFQGSTIAVLASKQASFMSLVQLVDADEASRIASLDSLRVGDGPFVLENRALRVLTNLVWIGELACAGLLAVARTRAFGVALGIVIMLGIELVARELAFAITGITCLLVCSERDGNTVFLPVAALLTVLLFCLRSFGLPFFFT